MKLPLGFRYAAVYAGIRKTNKDDLALIVSDIPARTAAVFTLNQVVAAPVTLAKKHLKISKGKAQAFLINAGNANCATRTGEMVAALSVSAAGKALGIRREYVLPASTGVIGVELDSRLIVDALPKLASELDASSFDRVAAAIMTTDLVPKTAVVTANGTTFAGMTKGSGMIQPNLATTLGFVMTDANLSLPELRSALKDAIGKSYNRISVDGDTSTNDMVAVLANGASGKTISKPALTKALTDILQSLAQQIARDGEGASKLITIDVAGATNEKIAERIARSIANSPLVKTAIAGCDPNWGRVIAAAGYSGVQFDPATVNIDMQGIPVCRKGLAAPFSEATLKSALGQADVHIRVSMGSKGRGQARFWTCDFTEDYIRINASYRT